MKTVAWPSNRNTEPCTTGRRAWSEASLSRYRVGKLSAPSTITSWLRDEVEDVVDREALLVGDDVDVGVDIRQRLASRLHLGAPDSIDPMEDLSLEIGHIDDVVVDDADRAHPGGRQIEGGGRSETAGADQEHPRIEQPGLAGLAHFGEQQVTAVAAALVAPEGEGSIPLPALALPALDAARQRADVGVAESSSDSAASADRSPTAQYRMISVAGSGTRPAMVLSRTPAGDVGGVADGAELVLVALAHVDEHRPTEGRLRFLGETSRIRSRAAATSSLKVGMGEIVRRCVAGCRATVSGQRVNSLTARIGRCRADGSRGAVTAYPFLSRTKPSILTLNSLICY